MSSDPLTKFLKANAAAPPPAPGDELARIQARIAADEAPKAPRPRRGRLWAGGGLAAVSFALALSLTSWQSRLSVGPRAPGIPVASTPFPAELLDREVSDYFDETLGAFDRGYESWGYDEEIIL